MMPGERSFAARLLTKLEDDYHCWYDVPVGRKQLRPDFIILHPGRGILVLEVKDWKMPTLRNIDRMTVELVTDRGIKHVPNPLEQARTNAIAIKESLETDPFLIEQSEGRYKGHLLFPWGFGVVLTNITRKQFDQAQLGLAIPPEKVICQDEMRETVDAEEFQSRLWGMFNHNFGRILALSHIDRIRWHLFPEIRIEQGNLYDAPSTESRPNDDATPSAPITEVIPDIVKIMDKEQERVARNMGDGHRMIHGVAGSGKTMILAYRCLQLCQSGVSKPILVLCFNKALAARLADLLRSRGAGDNVQIRHFHGWCKDMCALYQLDLPNPNDALYDRQVAAVIASVESGRVPRAQYAAILIDEGHDFEPEWFKLIVQMLDPETDSLLLVYDDVQGIYKRKRPKTWASVGINVPGRRSTILKMNYRNTAEALDVAYRFVADYLDEGKATEETPIIRPESGLRHGTLPTLIRFDDIDAEINHIAAWLKKFATEGIAYRTMAILCRFRNQQEKFAAMLRKQGVPASVVAYAEAPETSQQQSEDAVQVLTMHASKGLEFYCVAIPDLGSMPSAKQPEAEEGRILYVAMTRATDELLLTHHTASRFTKRLQQEIAATETA